MELVKLHLITKNNKKNGFYMYQPIVKIGDKYYFCQSVKTSCVIKTVDLSTVVVTREIPQEFIDKNI